MYNDTIINTGEGWAAIPDESGIILEALVGLKIPEDYRAGFARMIREFLAGQGSEGHYGGLFAATNGRCGGWHECEDGLSYFGHNQDGTIYGISLGTEPLLAGLRREYFGSMRPGSSWQATYLIFQDERIAYRDGYKY